MLSVEILRSTLEQEQKILAIYIKDLTRLQFENERLAEIAEAAEVLANLKREHHAAKKVLNLVKAWREKKQCL